MLSFSATPCHSPSYCRPSPSPTASCNPSEMELQVPAFPIGTLFGLWWFISSIGRIKNHQTVDGVHVWDFHAPTGSIRFGLLPGARELIGLVPETELGYTIPFMRFILRKQKAKERRAARRAAQVHLAVHSLVLYLGIIDVIACCWWACVWRRDGKQRVKLHEAVISWVLSVSDGYHLIKWQKLLLSLPEGQSRGLDIVSLAEY